MAIIEKRKVRYATQLHSGFSQIIKDSRFPICRPYGTIGDDKDYDFGTKFWDGTYYRANAENARYLQNAGLNKRSKKLKEDYIQGKDEITNDDWNAALTKMRQEFAIRYDFDTKAMQSIQLNRVFGVSDNDQFFSKGDVMLQFNYQKFYCDILTMLLYEAHDATPYSDRIPASRISMDIYDVKSGQMGSMSNLNVNANAEPIEEGYHEGNNWFTGYPMREYRYRHAVYPVTHTRDDGSTYETDERVPLTGRVVDNEVQPPSPMDLFDNGKPLSIEDAKVVNMYPRKNLLTDHTFGYTPSETFTIKNSILNSEFTVTLNKRPRGNFDYVKMKKLDGINGGWLPVVSEEGFYEPSDQFKEIIKFMKAFRNTDDVPYVGIKQIPDGKDEYGNQKYKTQTKNGRIKLLAAITLPQDAEGYSISVKAEDINNYFMHVINLLSSVCICNCNYCSCYGHEASCTCYVVKVNGWCYSYMYI